VMACGVLSAGVRERRRDADPGLLAASPATLSGVGDCGDRRVLWYGGLDCKPSGPKPIVSMLAVSPRIGEVGAAWPPF
jgi:hypothetical protein